MCVPQAARQRRPAKKAARQQQQRRRAGGEGGATLTHSGLAFGALSACTGRRRKPHVVETDAEAECSGVGIEDASEWIEEADLVIPVSGCLL